MPINTDGSGNAGREAIWRQLEALAAEQRKANPRLTLEQARAAAYSTPAGKTYLEQWKIAKAADVSPEQATDRRSKAWAKIEAAAAALQKGDSSLTVEKARDQVMKSHPELVAEYRGEEGSTPIGAPASESAWRRSIEISKSDRTIAELANDRLLEVTKAEQAANETLIKLDPTVQRLTKEQAFVIAVSSPAGKEAYDVLRGADADLTPAQARQAAVDRIEKSVTDALTELRKRDPVGYAAAFGSAAAPAIAAPPAAAVTKWQPYGAAPQDGRSWVQKDGFGSPVTRLHLLDPAGRSAADIRKSWHDGTLDLGEGATGSWYFTNDAEFHGRIVKAGSVVIAVPAESRAA